MSENDIDFVITWVDGNDPEWQKEKRKYLDCSSDADEMGMMESRFREWDLLRFLFRGIEKFAPWVRKIHFVTCGHVPQWLNLEHPKLNIVSHRDYIPEKYLPTFNSHAIEFNFHRIKGLSEHFVYFNDDTFLCKPASPEDFFVKGIPCDFGMMDCLIPRFAHTSIYQLNAISILNEHFSVGKTTSNRKLWFNRKYGTKGLIKNIIFSRYQYFVGFQNDHLPQNYLKSTFNEIWDLEGDRLDKTCMSKFRATDNISIWMIRYWQLVKNQFSPINPVTRGKLITEYNQQMLFDIEAGKYQMICINDLCETQDDFDFWQPRIYAAFEKSLPTKSSFEI